MTAIRRPGAASAAVLLGVSVSLVAAHLIAPQWSRRAGLDVWNLPSANAALRSAEEDQSKVSADAARRARRREAANQIAAQLGTGTVTLSTATDEVMEVFHDDSGTSVVLESLYDNAPTERHRFARHVIDRVKRVLADEPERLAVVVPRLEDEYRALSASPAAPTVR